LAASFFNTAEVEPVLRGLVIVFPLQGLAVVAESLARRDLQFRWLSTLDVKAYGFGYGIVAVTCALLGFGVWALVYGEVAQTALRTVFLLRRFRPPTELWPERAAFRELLYFGGGFTLAKIANFFAVKGDNLMVGHLLGPTALGVYGLAYHLMAAPTGSFGTV
jgi:O-antigen/teichoic acid export membrane protein